MKKDYIKGLGDTADFVVVGAGYDVAEARKFVGVKLKWTHFHIGCLTNKDEVIQQKVKPKFTVIDALNLCIKPEDVKSLNQLGQFRATEIGCRAEAAAHGINLEPGVSDMVVAFKEPFVFEVMGAGFEKQPNRTALSLRFPRVLKIHWDRDWIEAVTMEELQDMARAAKLVPSDDLAMDVAQWVEQLKKVDRGVQGVLAPWENSQDAEVETKETPTNRPARTARRTRSKSEAPPMIRMDTMEMSQSEYRLESGAVLCRPTSMQSQTSFATGSPLPTPPTSSPFRAAMDGVANKHFATSSTLASVHDPRKRKIAETESEEVTSSDEATQFKRVRRFFRAQDKTSGVGKRKVAETEIEDVPSGDEATQFKRVRRFFHAQNRQNETQQLRSSPLAASPKILRNLTNSARPRETPAVKPATRRSGRSKTPESFLVRKIPVGNSGLGHRQPKSRAIVQRSSPGGETAASKRTSQAASQQTAASETSSRPALSPIRKTTPSPTSNRPAFSATASAIQQPSHSPQTPSLAMNPLNQTAVATPKISLPNLHTAQILLSPCIAGTPYITEDLLASQDLGALPFPQTPNLPNPTPPSSTGKTESNTTPFVLFIESKRHGPTVEVLKDLARQIQHWPKGMKSVAVWDWRVLEGLVNLSGGAVAEKAEEYFQGTMSWDEEKAELEAVWRDGKVTRGKLPDE